MERAFSTVPNHYRDRTLFQLNKDEVSELNVVCRDPKDSTKVLEVSGKFNVQKGIWSFDKPEVCEGNSEKVNEFLARYTGLLTDDWYDRDTSTSLGFDVPELRTVIKRNDGSIVTMIAGKEINGNRYVKIEGDDHKYLVRKDRITSLKPVWGEFKALSKPAGNGSNVLPGSGAGMVPAGLGR